MEKCRKHRNLEFKYKNSIDLFTYAFRLKITFGLFNVPHQFNLHLKILVWLKFKPAFWICYVLGNRYNGKKIILASSTTHTAQKMKFSIMEFFSKYDQICRELRICSHLLEKLSIKNFIFCALPDKARTSYFCNKQQELQNATKVLHYLDQYITLTTKYPLEQFTESERSWAFQHNILMLL